MQIEKIRCLLNKSLGTTVLKILDRSVRTNHRLKGKAGEVR